jgi:hypothetical protein
MPRLDGRSVEGAAHDQCEVALAEGLVSSLAPGSRRPSWTILSWLKPAVGHCIVGAAAAQAGNDDESNTRLGHEIRGKRAQHFGDSARSAGRDASRVQAERRRNRRNAGVPASIFFS